jgi:hypothetical protein
MSDIRKEIIPMWDDYLATEFRAEDLDEPMDGDEVQFYAEVMEAKLNLASGNITDEEYTFILKDIAKTNTDYRDLLIELKELEKE